MEGLKTPWYNAKTSQLGRVQFALMCAFDPEYHQPRERLGKCVQEIICLQHKKRFFHQSSGPIHDSLSSSRKQIKCHIHLSFYLCIVFQEFERYILVIKPIF